MGEMPKKVLFTKKVEMVRNAERGALYRQEEDGMDKGEGGEEGLKEDGWSVRGVISNRRDCRGRNCTTMLHDAYRHILTPHKSLNMMKGKKKQALTGDYLAMTVSTRIYDIFFIFLN